jgi:hypothetical protein
MKYILGNYARLEAIVKSNGSETSSWFEWGTSQEYTNYTTPQSYNWPSDIWISQDLIGLPNDTLIHVRLVSQNIYGITYGSDTTFSTNFSQLVSEPMTLSADSITKISAQLRGKCKLHGTQTWGNFIIGNEIQRNIYFTPEQYLVSDTSEIEVMSLVEDLVPNTVYIYSFEISFGSNYGNIQISGADQTFSTNYDSSTKGLIIPIELTDNLGHYTIHNFGVHANATSCIDKKLGEQSLPPSPPEGAFEGRFIGKCLGLGSYLDLHSYFSPIQVDTYKLKFQTNIISGYPVRIKWPNLDSLYNGEVKLKIINDLVDMKSVTFYDVENPDISVVNIIAEGPRPINSEPIALTDQVMRIGPSHCQIGALVNPNGLATIAWFEYGTSTEYGEVTDVQGVGNEAGFLPLNTFVFGLQNEIQYHYRVVAQNAYGITHGSDKIFTTMAPTGLLLQDQSPEIFAVHQNYPNPFNPSTQITFSVPKATDVTLKIYDILGQEIATVVNERKQPGEYNVTWNAEGVPSGVYFYRIVAGEFIETKKMVLIR